MYVEFIPLVRRTLTNTQSLNLPCLPHPHAELGNLQLSPRLYHEGLEEAVSACEQFVGGPLLAEFPLLRDRWRAATADLRQRADVPWRHAYVGILGPTGVGKSSLMNALIGARVLPAAGNGVSTTSKVIEVVYNRELDQDPNAERPYKIRVHLMTPAQWSEFRAARARVCGVIPPTRSLCTDCCSCANRPHNVCYPQLVDRMNNST